MILLQDAKYAARKLLHSPGFTTVAVLTLALAIGASTAIFSVVNGILLNPLPFASPDRLVFIASTGPTGVEMPASPQDFTDYGAQSHVFNATAAVDLHNVALKPPGAQALRVNEARVGASFFSLLGVQAGLGRFFGPGEDSASATPVAVLSDGAWRRYFGADPRVLGQTVSIDTKPYQVIGVAKSGLTFPSDPEVWVPAVWQSFEIGDANRGYHSMTGVGRLKPGVTIDSAWRSLNLIAARLAIRFPKHNAKIGAFVQSLRENVVGSAERPLWLTLGAVGFVLLIACANVANLLLVRASARGGEMALRTALGGSRSRIVRQLVTESVLLSVGAAVLGAILASWAVAALVAYAPQGLPRLTDISVDARVLAFTAGVAILTGTVFGLVPAWHVVRSDVSQMLRGTAARGNTAAGANRTRTLLVLSEMALATVLLVGAGLLVRSMAARLSVDPGFQPNRLIVFDALLVGDKYQYDPQVNAFANEVTTRLAALPGAQSVAVGADRSFDPNGAYGAQASFTVDGQPPPTPGLEPVSRVRPVSPSFFTTTGMSLARGRFFTEAENRLGVPPVLVVNQALVDKYFPGQNIIGTRVTFGFKHDVTAAPGDTVRVRGEIVGVVKNAVYGALGETPRPEAYVAYATAPFAATFLVRTSVNSAIMEEQIRRVMTDVDRNVPIYELGSMDQAMSSSVAQPRFYMVLFGAFAAIALLLAALGIYGVVSYAVSQRTREFGIRIALGATRRDVSRSVVGRGLALTIGGIAIGVAAAVLMTRMIQALLYGVAPLDTPTFVAVALVLGSVAAFASWIPARRASAVDPVLAMRAE